MMAASPAPWSRRQQAQRLTYLLAQHPLRWHARQVRRGHRAGWLEEFARYWSEPGLPIDNFAGFQALRYHYATTYRKAIQAGAPDLYQHEASRCMLFSFIWRRELHPLRWLPWAWHLRGCRRVVEYGAGAAPFAHGLTRAWPWPRPHVTVADIEWRLLDYCRWRFALEPGVYVQNVNTVRWELFDGVVCTETFEHLPDPEETAHQMRRAAEVIVFDYAEHAGEAAGRGARAATLAGFARTGRLSGPSSRGLYIWRRTGYLKGWRR